MTGLRPSVKAMELRDVNDYDAASIGDRVKERVGIGSPGSFIAEFVAAEEEKRHWGRKLSGRVPA